MIDGGNPEFCGACPKDKKKSKKTQTQNQRPLRNPKLKRDGGNLYRGGAGKLKAQARRRQSESRLHNRVTKTSVTRNKSHRNLTNLVIKSPWGRLVTPRPPLTSNRLGVTGAIRIAVAPQPIH